MERNTEMANFIGLVFLLEIQNLTNLFSFMRVNGGEDYLMVSEFIKKLMETYILEYSKMA